MKNLKYHCETVFGSLLQVGLNEYDPDDPEADRCYSVYRMYDGEQTYYAVYNDYELALAVYEQQKFLPVTGG